MNESLDWTTEVTIDCADDAGHTDEGSEKNANGCKRMQTSPVNSAETQ